MHCGIMNTQIFIHSNGTSPCLMFRILGRFGSPLMRAPMSTVPWVINITCRMRIFLGMSMWSIRKIIKCWKWRRIVVVVVAAVSTRRLRIFWNGQFRYRQALSSRSCLITRWVLTTPRWWFLASFWSCSPFFRYVGTVMISTEWIAQTALSTTMMRSLLLLVFILKSI